MNSTDVIFWLTPCAPQLFSSNTTFLPWLSTMSSNSSSNCSNRFSFRFISLLLIEERLFLRWRVVVLKWPHVYPVWKKEQKINKAFLAINHRNTHCIYPILRPQTACNCVQYQNCLHRFCNSLLLELVPLLQGGEGTNFSHRLVIIMCQISY